MASYSRIVNVIEGQCFNEIIDIWHCNFQAFNSYEFWIIFTFFLYCLTTPFLSLKNYHFRCSVLLKVALVDLYNMGNRELKVQFYIIFFNYNSLCFAAIIVCIKLQCNVYRHDLKEVVLVLYIFTCL